MMEPEVLTVASVAREVATVEVPALVRVMFDSMCYSLK